MPTITLAANYITGTDPFFNDENEPLFQDVGWGHLQLVMGGQEIEVQAPTGFWDLAYVGAIAALGPVAGWTVSGLASFFDDYNVASWQFPVSSPIFPRDHTSLSNTPNYGDSFYYGTVTVDITYEDRAEADVWVSVIRGFGSRGRLI